MADIFDKIGDDKPQGDIFDQIEPQQPPSKPGALGSFIEGALVKPLASVGLMAQELATPPKSPLEAAGRMAFPLLPVAKGLLDAQMEQGRRAQQEWQAGNFGSAARRGLASITPIVGPAIENLAETATTEGKPWEALGSGAAMALPMIPKIKPLAAGGMRGAAGPTASALEQSAAKSYLSTLLPGKRNVPKAEQVAGFLAEERPMALTRGQLQRRAAEEKAAAGPAAGTAYVNVPGVMPQELVPIFDEIGKLRDKHVNVKGSNVQVNPGIAKALDNLEANLNGMTDEWGIISAETLDDFRDKIFRGAVDPSGNVRATAPAALKTIEKGVANSIRRVLDDKSPSAARANAEYHLWSKAYGFLEDARRTEIAAKAGIQKGSAQGFGALVERTIPRPARWPLKLMAVFDSTAWNTVSGATKAKFADLISKGNFDAAADLMIKTPGAGAVINLNLTPPPFPPPPQTP